jgi:hypothetical protein
MEMGQLGFPTFVRSFSPEPDGQGFESCTIYFIIIFIYLFIYFFLEQGKKKEVYPCHYSRYCPCNNHWNHCLAIQLIREIYE